MLHKIFDNDLVAIPKNKDTLTFNKPAYIVMLILELSKVLMHEFHYSIIQKLLFTDPDNLMYETRNEEVYKDFSNNKEMFDFNNYSTKPKYIW